MSLIFFAIFFPITDNIYKSVKNGNTFFTSISASVVWIGMRDIYRDATHHIPRTATQRAAVRLLRTVPCP